MSSQSTGLGRICCPTVGVPVYTWVLSMYTHTQQCQRKSTYNRRGRLLPFSFLFLSFFFSLFISLHPFLKSCNTGKICKPWSGNSGFSQWEHSVIPAGLCRRVNTFFSQARNSLAGERAAEREEERRREKAKRKEERWKTEYEKVTMVRKKRLFLATLLLFSLVFYFLVNRSHRWSRNQLPQIQTHTLTRTHTRVTQAN